MGLPETQLAQVMDAMAEGLVVLDTRGRIALWNRAMETLTGYDRAAAVGRDCSFLACEGLPAGGPDCLLQSLRADVVDSRTCSLRPRRGTPVPVRKTATLLRDDAGRVQGIVETVTDLRPLRHLEAEVAAAHTPMAAAAPGRLVGRSHRMRQVFENVNLAAQSEATVLITGETGTGKELVAEAIHFGGTRKSGPLVKVNGAALSETLLESELFGHVAGAFTGAMRDKQGRFAAAHGGTLFLDEIGDLGPAIQLKLLRVLQERQIEPVGSSRTQDVDVRILAATHRDLRQRVRDGHFREDLYYRLRVFALEVPPLRERKEDIPLLVERFRERFNAETGKRIRGISAEVRHCLMDYCWPGNIRELENTIAHAYVTCQTDTIGLFDLPVELRQSELRAAECARHGPPQAAPGGTGLTRERLEQALTATRGNKAAAARRLGIHRATVWRKIRQWGLDSSAWD